MEKTCKKCKLVKPLTDFYDAGKYKQSYCKPCDIERMKEYRLLNSDKLTEQRRLAFQNLTPKQKSEHNLKKKHVEVKCRTCEKVFTKRQDTLKKWSGLCVHCIHAEVVLRPEMKEHYRQCGIRGAEFIRKIGHLPLPKMENRKRGKTHFMWGLFREKNPRWIVDRSKLKVDDRRSLKNNCWIEDCKERDGRKCKINTKDCAGQLEVHHILSWKEYPELRHVINNGITLCHFHHPRKREDEKRLSSYFTSLLEKNATQWVSF